MNPLGVPDTELAVLKYVITCFGRETDSEISAALESKPREYAKYKLLRKYGKAANYVCYDCSSPARKWSYLYDDEGEFKHNDARFSLSPERYVPRCGVCYYQWITTQNTGEVFTRERCTDEHVKHVPFLSSKHYEFTFCRICGTYKRSPRKGYNAQNAFPALQALTLSFAGFNSP